MIFQKLAREIRQTETFNFVNGHIALLQHTMHNENSRHTESDTNQRSKPDSTSGQWRAPPAAGKEEHSTNYVRTYVRIYVV